MSRGLSSALVTELSTDNIRPVYLVSIELENSTLLYTTNIKDILYNSTNYVTASTLLSVGNVTENTDLGASGMQISLSGMNGTVVNAARDEDYQGKAVDVYLGFVDDNSDLIGAMPFFSGFTDTINFTQSADNLTAILQAEHKLIRLRKSNKKHYTNEQQVEKFAGDLGLEFVNAINRVDLVWGG